MKIGIVTISYNQRRFLSDAIESVLSINVRDRLKYVIVDPGSADGSRDVIRRYGSRVDTSIFEPDRGPADGLNKGFAACNDCEILSYLNSDDRFPPGALDCALNYFEEKLHVDVLLGATAVIDATGARSFRSRVSDVFDVRRYAIGACNVFQQGTFFRRSAFERTAGFNEANYTCWDGELVVDMALAGATFKRTTRILGEFRRHGDSITGSGRFNDQYARDRERIREKIIASGIPPYSALQAGILRTIHRANPLRQMQYLLAA